MHPIDELRAAVEAAAGDLRNGKPAPKARASLERPKKAGFGDYSTNAAMLLAPALGAPPREIAERLGERLTERLGEAVDHVEVAGPGFLNVFLADAWYVAAARQIVAAGDGWGRGHARAPGEGHRRVRLGQPDRPADRRQSGRHAAYGDALARLLELAGHEVTREYYFNDAGSQVDEARRVGARPRAPRAGARGRLPGRLRDRHRGADPGRGRAATPRSSGVKAAALIMESIRATLAAYRVEFDSFFLEGSLHEGDPSPIAIALRAAARAGPLVRVRGRAVAAHERRSATTRTACSSAPRGAPTYFAADVAYHENKVQRGFDRLIDVLGADHHGYIGRMKGVMEALGHEPDRLEIPILQFVHVVEGGERAKMSKRRGDFVTLDELIETIGVDATRWFMISRSHESTIDLDLELARQAGRREPGLLRPVRARADRLDPAQRGPRAGRGARSTTRAAARSRSTPPSAT